MNNKITNVADIIDIEYLQVVQDSLGRIVGITTALLDPEGVPISRPTNLHAFCAMMQASDSGLKMCMKTNAQLIAINKQTHDTAILTCPSSGLKTAAVPIFLGKQYLGSWLIGQIRMENIDLDLIQKTSQQAGIPEETAKENISLLPIITEEEFGNILSFLKTATKSLTDMVEVNHTLNERNNELLKLTSKLDNSVRAFRDFINMTDVGAYLIDFYTGKLIMYNNTYRAMWNLSDKEMENTCCFEHMQQQDFCNFCPKDMLIDEKKNPLEPYHWEHYNYVVDMWLSLTSRALYWIDGRLTILTTFVDITARKHEEERITYLAYHDQVLNIANGLKLFEDLLKTITNNNYIICFDVKGLSEINNVYGREAGDNLLRSIVKDLSYLPEYGACLYRIKGDDFAIMAQNCTEETAIKLAEKVYARFGSPWLVDMGEVKQKMFTGVHMGVINADKKPESHSYLLNIIERVLSFARMDNGLIIYDEKMNELFKQQMALKVSLKSCVLNNMKGFSLHYQPIVDLNSNKWTGVEALCRWNSTDLGNIPPDIFIDEAERLGLIGLIGDWVFNEALSQIKVWGLDTLPDFSLAINLSPIQLRDPELFPKVVKFLNKYHFPPNKLNLEVTESSEIQFNDQTIKVLSEIRNKGISLSIDDFGTGYASFSNLKNLPIGFLKMDRSFVNGIESDTFLLKTMYTMVDFAQSAGLQVIAEGVETEEQRQIIEFSGVNLIQGYFFSKPLSVEDMEKNLSKFIE